MRSNMKGRVLAAAHSTQRQQHLGVSLWWLAVRAGLLETLAVCMTMEARWRGLCNWPEPALSLNDAAF